MEAGTEDSAVGGSASQRRLNKTEAACRQEPGIVLWCVSLLCKWTLGATCLPTQLSWGCGSWAASCMCRSHAPAHSTCSLHLIQHEHQCCCSAIGAPISPLSTSTLCTPLPPREQVLLKLIQPSHLAHPVHLSTLCTSPYVLLCAMCALPQVLLKLIQPYTRVRLPFISRALAIPEADVEQLLVSLILDNRIQGHVDQVGRLRGPGCLGAAVQWDLICGQWDLPHCLLTRLAGWLAACGNNACLPAC